MKMIAVLIFAFAYSHVSLASNECSIERTNGAFVVSVGGEEVAKFPFGAKFGWASTNSLEPYIKENADATYELAQKTAKHEVRLLTLEGKCQLN